MDVVTRFYFNIYGTKIPRYLICNVFIKTKEKNFFQTIDIIVLILIPIYYRLFSASKNI